MKKIILFISSVLVFFSVNIFAQKSFHDIINIKEKVAQQIKEISETEAAKTQKKDLTNKKEVLESSVPFMSKISFIKTFVFVEGSLLILIGLSFKRRKQEMKKYKISRLKENIRKLRAEKIGSIFDSKNYKLRKRLIMQPIKITEGEICRKAKEYSISKGELHLALKIKLMQSSG